MMIGSCGDYRFYEIGEDGLYPISDIAAYAPPAGAYGADLLASCDPPALGEAHYEA